MTIDEYRMNSKITMASLNDVIFSANEIRKQLGKSMELIDLSGDFAKSMHQEQIDTLVEIVNKLTIDFNTKYQAVDLTVYQK